jgi:hypothetical protein
MSITNNKFQYNMSAIPFFFTDIDNIYTNHYKNVMTRRFYKLIRTFPNITEYYVLDEQTGLTCGEMALYIIHTKNVKRSKYYNRSKK